ncbi:MAG: hypothetical protein ACOX6W_07255 [Lentisphaeria bacterium]|jgi:hypothetical protein
MNWHVLRFQHFQTTEPLVRENKLCFFFIWLLGNSLGAAKNILIEI